MVTILAQKLGRSRKLIIYPAQRTGTVHTSAEYTINTDQVTGSNVIREIATWDTHQYTNAVRNSLARGQGSHDYIFALQQAGRDIEDGTHPNYHEQDRIFNRKNRVRGIIANCLDPGEGEDPWNDSFAYWNRWRDKNGSRGNPEITLAQQRDYLAKVRDELT